MEIVKTSPRKYYHVILEEYGSPRAETEQFWGFWSSLIAIKLMLLAISIKSESITFSKDREPLQFFCSRSTQVRAENFFKGSQARSLTARDQTLKIWFSAVRKTSWSRSDTSWSRSISGISKNPAYKLSDLTHFYTKTLQILSTPSESADKHNLALHSCSNQPQSRNTLSLFLSKPPLLQAWERSNTHGKGKGFEYLACKDRSFKVLSYNRVSFLDFYRF